ncbi:MAG: hypothetical protein ACRD0K_03465 [Egibacteraceae bacterium]
MITRTWAALVGLVAIATAACAALGRGSGVRDDLTSDEALARVHQIVDETADAVLPGAPRQPRVEDTVPRYCEEADIAPHVSHTWGVRIPLQDGQEPAELLSAVEAHWEDLGYDIDRRWVDDTHPELLGSADGFTFRALAVPGSGRLVIDANSPCVPNPEYPG